MHHLNACVSVSSADSGDRDCKSSAVLKVKWQSWLEHEIGHQNELGNLNKGLLHEARILINTCPVAASDHNWPNKFLQKCYLYCKSDIWVLIKCLREVSTKGEGVKEERE